MYNGPHVKTSNEDLMVNIRTKEFPVTIVTGDQRRHEDIVNPKKPDPQPQPGSGGSATMKEPPKKVYKTIHRQVMFPAKTLTTEEEIDAYVERIRTNMKQLLHGCDGIKLS